MDSFTGGIYTADGQFVENCLLDRGHPAKLQKSDEHLSGTYIYGGCLFSHYGHLIWDSLSRLYTIRQHKGYKIIYTCPYYEQLDSVIHLFLKNIGVENEVHLIKVPTSVENLIYSLPGSALNPLYITDEQLNALKCFQFSKEVCANDSVNKLWLSRSNLELGTIVNELVIEKVLEKIGFKIIHPEMLPLQEQVRLISTAEIVACFDGSALFTILFSENIFSKFYIFNRRPRIPEAIPYVFQKRNVKFELHYFDLEYIAGEMAWACYNHTAPEKVIEVLKIT